MCEIPVDYRSRGDIIRIYPIGDVHIGCSGSKEMWLRWHIKRILDDPHGYVLLGGDLIEGINHMDKKRWDFDSLPDWVLNPRVMKKVDRAMSIRHRLGNLVEAQAERACDFLRPLAEAGRIIGAVEGNHENTVHKYNGFDIHGQMCKELGIIDLTSAAMVRLRMRRQNPNSTSSSLMEDIWIEHGTGAGRSRGAEMGHLGRLIAKSNCAVVIRGHSHTFCIATPDVLLKMPAKFNKKTEALNDEVWAGNWGTYKVGYKRGASSYIEKASYPARPSWTIVVNYLPGREGGSLRWITACPLHVKEWTL